MKRLASLVSVAILVGCAPDDEVHDAASTSAMPLSLEPGVVCGDGRRMNGEECDDGNTTDGDGCSAGCLLEGLVASISRGPVCGDSQVGFSEECDDGNLVGGDGCSAQCDVEPGFSCTSIVIEGGLVNSICSANPAGCGDAVRDESEQCDDGDLASGDGCSATCTIEEGFTCVGAVGQLSLCTSPGCGDGVLAEDEACDDGNVAGGDGCGTTCEVEPGWSCDAVFIPCGYDGCTALRVSVCARSEGCGDRRHVAGEQCDDGNVSDGDGCNASCLLEDGFTCFDVVSTAPQDAPPSYTRCEPRGCGDGAINESEACDDWNLEDADGCSSGCSLEPGYTCGVSTVTALPEVLVHRTVDCVSLACGDGALDPGEVCDDGAGNGQAGFCSTDCRDRLPLALVETDPYALMPHPDLVGLIGSITLPDVLCVDAPPDPGIYQDRLRFLDDNGFLVGRIMVAREAFRVESPLLLFDDGLAPFDGRAALGMRTSMADAVFGTVEIGAGEMFVAPVAGAPTLGQCAWCGIGGFSQQQDFCFGEDGSPIGPGPGPCSPQGMTCPETRFRPERAIELAAPDFPADPLDGPGPVTLSCDRSCLIAGGLELCTEPSGGGPQVPGGLECIADSIVDARLCEQLGGGDGFTAWVRNCAGGCEGRTDGQCTLLGAVDESDLDLGCMFAACSELGLGRCCSLGDVPGFDAITDLDPDMAWMQCRLDPGPGPCDVLRLPPSLVPPESKVDTILQCSPSQVTGSGEQRCRLCDQGLGNKCVVGSVPNGLVSATFPRADFAPRPAEGDGAEELERLANSELRSRLGADPRRMGAGADPVALLTGEMVFEATDVAFPSRGVPLTFTRAYRSGALRSGALGPGFSHGYEERIEVVADPDNTRGAAGFCTRALHDDDNATCLLHHDGHGGTTLFGYDAASGNYLPAPGGRGVVHVSVPEDPIPRSVAAQGAGVPTYFLTEPGGITRTFDISGVLLSVKDEMGFGVELKYQLRSPKDVVIGGAWSGALPSGLIPLSERSLAAGFTRHVNRLNQMVLVGIEDSYGRELELGYRTYFDSDEDKRARRERRQRLHTLAYVDRETGERHVLVEYDYVTVPETNDAYLSRVTRYGLADGLAAAEPIVVEYEYAHDLLAAGGALAFSVSENGDVLPDSELGIAVDAALLDYASRLVACQRGLVFPPADIDNACGQPAILEGATGIGVAGTASLWRILQQHVADNIVRIRRAGEIEIETRYGANPLLPSFDRAMEQRYGALPALRAAPRPVREPGYGGTIVHRWLTNMPATYLMDVDDESLDERVKAAVPLAEHVPLEDEGSSTPGICQSLNADTLPLFRLHDPAGPRTDWRTRSLARTTYNCAAIAGRHARDLYAHDLIELPGTDEQAGTRREQLEADLNLACRFAEVKDREGSSRIYGLNYQGHVLVEAGPSPSGGGLAITRRRVNADGNVVEEIRPDCSSTEVVWAADDDDDDHVVGVDSGDGPNFDAGLALVRDEVASITERAPQDLVRANDPVCSGYAVHLEPPVVEDEHGVARVATDRRWVFAYEPLYQQVVSATGPDGVTTLRRYDYQQLPANSRLADELVARAAARTGATVSAEVFVGADYDGDGSLAETSGGLVLEAVRGVDLGGGRHGDVGTRWQRNHSGRVVRESSIADVSDLGADFDFTHYVYYPDLDHAERGELSAVVPCSDPHGPLATTTRLREPDTWGASDRVRVFVAYDRLGGVRLRRLNDDDETTEVTIRDAVGSIAEIVGPGARHARYLHDGRGQLVLEEELAEPGSDTAPRIRHLAWGLQGAQLGECVELGSGGCEGLLDYAVSVNTEARAGGTIAAPPFAGVSSVALVDREDRDVGVVGAEGGTTLRVRNAAGAVVNDTIDGTPPLRRSFEHDVAGRVVAIGTGQASDESLEQFHRYDGFGRLVGVQRLAPLSQNGFIDNVGTIERVRFDILDREVGRFVQGDDGNGARRMLSVTRLSLNELGAARFIHRAAAGLPPSLPLRPDGMVTGDDFATEELGYDSALRPVSHQAEGIPHVTMAGYDGFGLRFIDGRQQSLTIDVDPAARRRTITRTPLDDNGVGAGMTARETSWFDGRGLLVERSLVDSGDGVERLSSYSYDELGRLRATLDAASRALEMSYDEAGRVTGVRESGPGGGDRETEYVLDRAGRVRVERPARDAPETSSEYDAMGRMLSKSSGAYVQHFGFDGAGRLVERRQGRTGERRLTLDYQDNHARPRALQVDGAIVKSFRRDGLLRVVEAVDHNTLLPGDGGAELAGTRPTLTSAITYDALGRVVRDTSTDTTIAPGRDIGDVQRGFADDLLGPHTLDTLSGSELAFGYSDRGTLETIERNGLGAISVGLEHQGGLWVGATVTGEESWSLTRTRDAFGFVRETGLAVKGQPVVSGDAVLRGPTGKITAELRFGPMLAATVRGYRYDDLGRLKEQVLQVQNLPSTAGFLSQVPAALAAEDAGAATLAPVANRVTTALNDADGLERATRDEHLREFTASFATGAGGVPPDVVNGEAINRDAFDRIRKDGELTYVFDALDRLVQVKRGPQEELLIAYDGLGRRRLERRQMRGGHVEDAVLEYDGANVIEESDRQTGAVLLAVTHAQGIDTPLVASTADGTFALRTNARGDVVAAALIGGGRISEEQQLDAWGERTMALRPGEPCVEGDEERDATRRVSGPRGKCAVQARILGRFGLAGARSHAGTKLVDMRNRVYAPHLRGFLTRDPLGNVDSESLFAYAAGDPINLRDPWGLTVVGDDPMPDGDCDLPNPPEACKPKPAPTPAAAPVSPPATGCDATCQLHQQERRDREAEEALERERRRNEDASDRPAVVGGVAAPGTSPGGTGPPMIPPGGEPPGIRAPGAPFQGPFVEPVGPRGPPIPEGVPPPALFLGRGTLVSMGATVGLLILIPFLIPHDGVVAAPQRGVGGIGWRGDAAWRDWRKRIEGGGDVEIPIGPDGRPIIPTPSEVIDLFDEVGISPDGYRHDPGHPAGGVSPHTNPHFNYFLPNGRRGTIETTDPPEGDVD